jgi:Na+-driven multidrug efflux pump
MVGINILQAAGKAARAFIVAIARPLVFLIPIVLLLVKPFGLNGIWASFPISDILNLTLTVFMIIPIVKQYRELASQSEGEKGIDSTAAAPG